jgi:hypothetical protein
MDDDQCQGESGKKFHYVFFIMQYKEKTIHPIAGLATAHAQAIYTPLAI